MGSFLYLWLENREKSDNFNFFNIGVLVLEFEGIFFFLRVGKFYDLRFYEVLIFL